MTSSPAPSLRTAALVVALSASLAGCAGGGGVLSIPTGPETTGARGVPGFDTRTYPGEDAMRAWRAASPYRWVGYYLPAPCYTGTSWQGRRESLRSMGWGIAVLFVGEQDWRAAAAAARADTATSPADSVGGADLAAPRCTRGNLSAERGRADAAEAGRAAAAEGFPPATVVYLDVERVDAVSDSLRAYVQAWVRALAEGRYRPGLYVHDRNADELHAAALEAVGRTAGDAAAPAVPLWVAKAGGFNLRRGPTESGFPLATVWQGVHDTDETWGGVSLRVDVNVADSDDPSDMD